MRVRLLEQRIREATGARNQADYRKVVKAAREMMINDLLREKIIPSNASSGYFKTGSGSIISGYFAHPQTGMDVAAYGGADKIADRLYTTFSKAALKPVQYGIVNSKGNAVRAMVSIMDPWEACYFLAGVWKGKSAKWGAFSRGFLESLEITKNEEDEFRVNPLLAILNDIISQGKEKMRAAHRRSDRTRVTAELPEFYEALREPNAQTVNWRKLAAYVLNE